MAENVLYPVFSSAQKVVLELEHITKSFGSTQVLKGISLSIKQGEFITFLGASDDSADNCRIGNPGRGERAAKREGCYRSGTKSAQC